MCKCVCNYYSALISLLEKYQITNDVWYLWYYYYFLVFNHNHLAKNGSQQLTCTLRSGSVNKMHRGLLLNELDVEKCQKKKKAKNACLGRNLVSIQLPNHERNLATTRSKVPFQSTVLPTRSRTVATNYRPNLAFVAENTI